MPEFTRDYVSAYADGWKHHLRDFIDQPVRAVEIGTFEGRSALWFLDNILTHPESRMWSIDPHYVQERYNIALRNLSEHPRSRQLTFLRGLSHRLAGSQPENSVDFAYIDGSHEAKDVLTDACVIFPKMKNGGVIIFDDYKWNPPDGNRLVLPQVGIDCFLTAFAPWLEVMHSGYQVAVRKISPE